MGCLTETTGSQWPDLRSFPSHVSLENTLVLVGQAARDQVSKSPLRLVGRIQPRCVKT